MAMSAPRRPGTGCADCRRAVERMTLVADELLTVAPVQEPPAGFESRVVEAMGLREHASKSRSDRRLTPRWLVSRIGPVVATAAVTAAALVGVYHDDHQVAERYRATLAEANGHSFQAAPLRDAAGGRAGVAFGYEGSPSWLLLTELRMEDGRTIPLRSLRLDSKGSWGGAIPAKLYEVASVQLVGKGRGDALRATFPQGSSERD